MARTVLVADDSIAAQRLFEMVLTREGYNVITVGSGSEVIARVKEKQPDLALIDATMPEVDGYQLCQTLKKDPQFKNLPVIMLAGTYEDVDREKGAKIVGAKAILAKPSKSQVIVSKVKEILALQEQLQRKKEKPKVTRPSARVVTAAEPPPQPEREAEVVQEPPSVEEEYTFDEDSEEVDRAVESEILDEEAEWAEGEEEAFPTAAYEEEPEGELFEEPMVSKPTVTEPMLAVAEVPAPTRSVVAEVAEEEVEERTPPMRSSVSPERLTLSEEHLDAIAEEIATRVAGKLIPALMQSLARYVLEIPSVKNVVENTRKQVMKDILPNKHGKSK